MDFVNDMKKKYKNLSPVLKKMKPVKKVKFFIEDIQTMRDLELSIVEQQQIFSEIFDEDFKYLSYYKWYKRNFKDEENNESKQEEISEDNKVKQEEISEDEDNFIVDLDRKKIDNEIKKADKSKFK